MKIKKYIKLIVLVTAILLSTTAVNAVVSGNYTGFCVGTNYGLLNINTSGDATTAASYYSNAGLNVYTTTIPTKTNMNGAHASNGRKYLASGFVFLSGHGNTDGMGC